MSALCQKRTLCGAAKYAAQQNMRRSKISAIEAAIPAVKLS
jgi:hypothetical protein